MWTSATLFVLVAASQAYHTGGHGDGGLPVDKVYGVNLGSWLLAEPWMLPNEWVRMGGDTCFETGPCSDCAASEFDLVKKIGQERADEVFREHWETWFSESDVRDIVNAGLNTVRIPIGFWIIESLVDRSTEFYPRGGLKQLKRGVQQLKEAGINVLLDFHAMPGVSSSNQMFAGRCTSDVEFYTPPNYFRALQWAAVMTFITHVDPAFGSVFGIEAINEPIMDQTKTPGYGDYLTDFVRVVRAVELALGIRCPGVDYAALFEPGASRTNASPAGNATASTRSAASSARNATSPTTTRARAATPIFAPDTAISGVAAQCGGRVGEVLVSIVPSLARVAAELGVFNPAATHTARARRRGDGANRQCLHTTFMDVLWQDAKGFNPADAAMGPAMFDDHLYFSFGGVADPNPDAYLSVICNLPRVKNDTELGNVPVVFGEWALSTNFNATDAFMAQWADAQKRAYAQSSGWIFWSFKIEAGNAQQRQWDYFTALEAGHFTRDPAALNDAHVCDAYVG